MPLNLGNLDGAKAAAERAAKPAQDICLGIPEEVAIGYHSCYGTLDGWPSRTPPDATGTVLLLNAVIEASGRSVEFVHFPTLETSDEVFFRPFEDLNLRGARAYVGAIHHLHGPDGLKAQIESIKKFLPEFGLAAPCGFGRAPERPGQLLSENIGNTTEDYIREIISEHTKAVEILGDVMSN